MQRPETPANEAARLQALRDHHILDTAPEARFDLITELAAHVLGAPIVLVSLIDADRQWFKSRYGLDAPETPRDVSFCGHVVASGAPLIVNDAFADPRFADNPLTTGHPRVVFYAGMPLRTADGFVLGTLCAIDHHPRKLSEHETTLLTRLAQLVVYQLEQRRVHFEREGALRRSQEELRTAESDLRALFDGMAEGVVRIAASGEITYANAAAERIAGVSLEQVQGREAVDPRWQSVREDGTAFAGADLPAAVALRTGQPQRNVIMGIEKPQGERVWVSINAEPLGPRGGGPAKAVISTFRDITTERYAERALAAERAFLEVVLARIPNSTVAIFDRERAVLQAFGAMRASLTTAGALEAWAPPGQRDDLRAAALRCLAGHSTRVDLTLEARRYEVTLVPFVDSKGDVTRGLALAYDVSERDRLRDQLARQERLVTTGTLAAGVGHEINNPLSFVSGNIDYVLDELRAIAGGSPSGRMKELSNVLVEAREGTERIRKIVRGLRAFAREYDQTGPTDVVAAIDTSINMANHEIRSKARLVNELGALRPVLGDESRLSQVFVNVLVNAAHAFVDADPTRNEIVIRGHEAPDGRAIIEISDNGPGIAPDVLPRIFDPFFTTKPIGVGTGLGLALSHSIVTSLGGEMSCRTQHGEGTTFRIVLPFAVQEPAAADVSPAPATKGQGRVLIVDDDEQVARSIARLLKSEHQVTVVTDPRQAWGRIEAGEQFVVVFCDLAMPHLSGAQLYERTRALRPALADRFVFITGGVVTDEARTFLAECPNERLEKPFNTQNLRGIARRFAEAADPPKR